MKRRWKSWLYIAGVLCMSVSCKKEAPNLDCDDGTCCGTTKDRYKFIVQLENVPADFAATGGGGFDFAPNTNAPMRSIPLCSINSYDISKLKHTSTLGTNLPSPYKYRVWGKVYQSFHSRILVDLPVYWLHVEKVEEIK
jgi:hypothetical protein